MELLTAIYNEIMAFTNMVLSLPLLILLIGGGLWITFTCDFVQIKHFGYMMKYTFGSMTNKGTEGQISPIQAMFATLANTIGTGNIIGVGSAIAIGGPGAIFWMWIIGFAAMALKYAEAVLGVATRTRDKDGNWKGGAPTYLAKAWKPLAIGWSASCIFALPIACGTHVGAIVDSAQTFGIPVIVSTVLFTIITFFVLRGGMHALVRVTDRLVPSMALIYMVTGVIIIALNIGNLLPALASIFQYAFTGTAAVGGFTGATLNVIIKEGCARGIYSNDGGNGGSSIMHARADVDHPVQQGMMGIFEVFVCTHIICTFTALVILVTGQWMSGDPGSVLAINAFDSVGKVAGYICALSLILFAASSALSLATMASLTAEDMFGKKIKYLSEALVIFCCFIGGTVGVDIMLPWVDVANMITISFNVIGMLMLTKLLSSLSLEFFKNQKDKAIKEEL